MKRLGTFTLFAGAGSLLGFALLNALELVLAGSPAIALRLLQFAACLLVALGAYASARAPMRARRFILLAAFLSSATTVAVLWRHPIHGGVSAIWAAATGRHAGSTLTRSIPAMDACINGHVVKYLPIVQGCFGRVGARPTPYYRGYYATVWLLYDLLPDGTQCDEKAETNLVVRRPG